MKKFSLLFLLLFSILVIPSCKPKSKNTCSSCDKNTLTHLKIKKKIDKKRLKAPKKKLKSSNLVDIQIFNSAIIVDLKYASNDNFMKMKLYSKLRKAYLQKDIAIRLGKCQDYLTQLNPNLHLLVYDAVRPLDVQQKMWNALDTIPVEERTKFVSNPASGSIHNYGAAVDLTICDDKGVPLDMGAGYDDIRQIAYPRLEEQFLALGELSEEQIKNRKLLRKVMESEGFMNIATEWWHFNACSRNEAKEKYSILAKE